MICHGFKGGIGTSSRIVDLAGTTFGVGVLVQANYGSRDLLRLDGRPVGALDQRSRGSSPELIRPRPMPVRSSSSSRPMRHSSPTSANGSPVAPPSGWRESEEPERTAAATSSSRSPRRTACPGRTRRHPSRHVGAEPDVATVRSDRRSGRGVDLERAVRGRDHDRAPRTHRPRDSSRPSGRARRPAVLKERRQPSVSRSVRRA